VFANCAGLIGKRTADGTIIDSDTAFCRYLLEQHNVAVVPGSCFGLAPFFRVSYAASEINLIEAIERIAAACRMLS
jgi:aspartate aminotransferase